MIRVCRFKVSKRNFVCVSVSFVVFDLWEVFSHWPVNVVILLQSVIIHVFHFQVECQPVFCMAFLPFFSPFVLMFIQHLTWIFINRRMEVKTQYTHTLARTKMIFYLSIQSLIHRHARSHPNRIKQYPCFYETKMFFSVRRQFIHIRWSRSCTSNKSNQFSQLKISKFWNIIEDELSRTIFTQKIKIRLNVEAAIWTFICLLCKFCFRMRRNVKWCPFIYRLVAIKFRWLSMDRQAMTVDELSSHALSLRTQHLFIIHAAKHTDKRL